jgi:hypothetical protein
MIDSPDLNLTSGLIVVTALIWIFWDIYVYIKGKKTISHYITNWSYYSPVIPFAVGFLCGHWFW